MAHRANVEAEFLKGGLKMSTYSLAIFKIKERKQEWIYCLLQGC